MSSTTTQLFRRHTETSGRWHSSHSKSQAQERSEETHKPNLVVEMSRIEHEVRQIFDDASPAERDNIIRFFEILIRNLKRQVGNG